VYIIHTDISNERRKTSQLCVCSRSKLQPLKHDNKASLKHVVDKLDRKKQNDHVRKAEHIHGRYILFQRSRKNK